MAKYSNKIKYVLPIVFATILTWGSVKAVSCLTGQQGGTGICSATSSQVGYVPVVSSVSPFAYTLSPNGAGSFTTTTIAGLTSTNFNLLATTTPEISTSTGGNIYLGFQPSYGIVVDGVNFPKTGAGIQSAINVCKTITACNTVRLTSGSYTVSGSSISFGRNNMRLIGEGSTSTTIQIDSGFSGGMMIDETLVGISNIEIANIGFDSSGKTSKGFIRFDQSNNVYIHDDQFTGATTAGGIWGIKIGKIGVTNSDSESSYNVLIQHNYFHDNNFGTFEGIIATQIRNSWINQNYFYNDTSSGAYSLLCYLYCADVEIAGNTFHAENANSIAVQESDQVNVHDNTIDTQGDFRGIVVINSIHSQVARNILTASSTTSLNAPAVMLFDRDAGPDGNPNRNATSTDISVYGNTITGFNYGVSMQNSGAGYKLWIQGLTTDQNVFTNVSVPIKLGTSAPDGVSNVFIRNNAIYSWNATSSSGAIQIVGNSSDITKFKNVYIENNYVAPSSGGSISGGIRIVGATAELIADNYVTGTGQGTNEISFANNAIANTMYGNTQSGFLFQVSTSTSPASFSILSSGRVGIGTTTPATSLDVQGPNLSLVNVGSGNFSNAVNLNQSRTFYGYKASTNVGEIQGGTGKGIEISVNNNTFGSGTIGIEVTSSSLVGVGTTTPPEKLSIDGGHIGTYKSSGATTTVSSCGTSPTFSGTDTAGEVTVGATATSCTVNFVTAYLNKPVCTVSEQTGSVVNALSYSITTSALTFSQTGLAAQIIDYTCIAK